MKPTGFIAKLHTLLGLVCCCLVACKAEKRISYNDAIEEARQFMNEGKLAEGFLAASAAISMDEERWEGYAVVALILNARGATNEARRYLDKALIRAPEEKKPTLHEMKKRFGQASHESSSTASGPRALASGAAARLGCTDYAHLQHTAVGAATAGQSVRASAAGVFEPGRGICRTVVAVGKRV